MTLKNKKSVTVVFTGDGKGKTIAALGLMARALGAGHKVAFVQFIKDWRVSEHSFIEKIMTIYGTQLTFYKGGLGFFEAGELSSNASKKDHIKEAEKSFELAYSAACSGEYQLVICDEINNAVHDGLLDKKYLKKIISETSPQTSLCLTGRNFSNELLSDVDIVTNMTKIKHHYDDGYKANEGIDY